MPDLKNTVTAIAAVGVIAASCVWIYLGQTTKSKHNLALHRRVGEVLAEQAAEVAGGRGKIVTIAIPTKEWPELKTQIEAFNKKLATLGKFEVRDYEMDTKDQPKYGVGTGLSGRRYVRTVKKNADAAVFVSFIGAAVYFVNQVDGFWNIIYALLKAAVWPAILIYNIFQSFTA